MPNTGYEAKPRYRRGTVYAADMAAYARLMTSDNHDEHSRLKRNLALALREEVTETQRKYLLMYYGEGLKMWQIAERCGVDSSCVSRTIKRGEKNLRRCLRFGAARLLEPPEE